MSYTLKAVEISKATAKADPELVDIVTATYENDGLAIPVEQLLPAGFHGSSEERFQRAARTVRQAATEAGLGLRTKRLDETGTVVKAEDGSVTDVWFLAVPQRNK